MKINTNIAAAFLSTMFLTQMMPELNAADTVTGEKAEMIENLARGFGSATLERRSNGEPYIVGRIDGTKYGIYFYGCENGKACQSIQFSAGWSGTKMTLESVNRWNRDKRFGKAYLDKEGDPRLEMDVNLDYGVTKGNFEDTFDIWTRVLKSFKNDFLN